ncbi:hypothetical protein ACLB2K_009866 [Fragaria x ananassa]
MKTEEEENVGEIDPRQPSDAPGSCVSRTDELQRSGSVRSGSVRRWVGGRRLWVVAVFSLCGCPEKKYGSPEKKKVSGALAAGMGARRRPGALAAGMGARRRPGALAAGWVPKEEIQQPREKREERAEKKEKKERTERKRRKKEQKEREERAEKKEKKERKKKEKKENYGSHVFFF